MAFEDGVFATFYDKPVQDKAQSTKEGYPVFNDTLYIKIMVPNAIDGVDRPANENDIKRFPKSYEAYQTGKEPAESGMPVEEWPQITTSEVAMLRALNIKSVEQLAEVPDSGIHRLGPGGHGLKTKAQKYLSSQSEIGTLQSRIKELERKLEKAETSVSEEPKRKPKRLKVAAK